MRRKFVCEFNSNINTFSANFTALARCNFGKLCMDENGALTFQTIHNQTFRKFFLATCSNNKKFRLPERHSQLRAGLHISCKYIFICREFLAYPRRYYTHLR